MNSLYERESVDSPEEKAPFAQNENESERAF
jgi:hypothetical protein